MSDQQIEAPTPLEDTTIALNATQRELVVGWKHGTKTYCTAHHERLPSDGSALALGDLHDSTTVELYCSACITECNAQGWPVTHALIYREGETELRAF